MACERETARLNRLTFCKMQDCYGGDVYTNIMIIRRFIPVLPPPVR